MTAETIEPDIEQTVKTCRTCEQDKPLGEFWRDRDAPDGRRRDCARCAQAKKRHRITQGPSRPAQPRRRAPQKPYRNSTDDPWWESARCAGQDLLLFFAADGERQPEREVREEKAKRFCRACPVRLDCLEAAIRRNDRHGVWGGLNEDERASERRRRMRRENAA